MGKELREKLISKCNRKSLTITAVAVIVSIVVHHLLYRGCEKEELSQRFNQRNQSKLYADDDEEFLQLVNDTYTDEDLVKWSPAPPDEGDPNEPGYMGAAVIIPPEKQKEAKKRFKENEFNVVASEMMSFNRTLTDGRYSECTTIEYPKKLATTSVIIIFRNEAWSTLLRTVWSVCRTSPRTLLKEIILVDDYSDRNYLLKELYEYVRNFPVPVIIKRTVKREGLIQARLLGVKYATGKVLTFLDAHCECNMGWLEPLLARVSENRKIAIAPVIDIISDDDFSVQLRNAQYSAFDSEFIFFWEDIPERELHRLQGDRTAPLRSPAMAGGLFAIDKEFFHKVGSYDEDMHIWGSENIEMSLRLWTCGGIVEQHPCSRVGHVFLKNSPHNFPDGVTHTINYNVARVVDVWVDNYKTWFYSINPEALKARSNVSSRIELRKRLRCKSFNWYLKNIYPESILLVKYKRIGWFDNIGKAGNCLDTLGHRDAGDTVGVSTCHNLGGNQLFMISEADEIRKNNLCLDGTQISAVVKLLVCHGHGGNQKWVYNENTKTFHHNNGSNCLTLQNDLNVTLEACDGSLIQQWKYGNFEVKLN